jgi:hypothetical protein
MAAQQVFGLLLAGVAVVIAYLGFHNRLPAVWAAAVGAGTAQPNQPAPAAQPTGSPTGLAGLKYAVAFGKAGLTIVDAGSYMQNQRGLSA